MRSPTVTPTRQRMAAQAAHAPDRVCATLAHLIDEDLPREASRQTSQASAAGIDGVIAQAYVAHLDEPLRDRHERLRRGRSQAPPGERVWRAKAAGGQRPIGKPAPRDVWENSLSVGVLPISALDLSSLIRYIRRLNCNPFAFSQRRWSPLCFDD